MVKEVFYLVSLGDISLVSARVVIILATSASFVNGFAASIMVSSAGVVFCSVSLTASIGITTTARREVVVVGTI